VGGIPAGPARAACRVRTMGEAVADPQIATRGILHRHGGATGVAGAFGVPWRPSSSPWWPRIDTPPPALGEHMRKIFAELNRRAGSGAE